MINEAKLKTVDIGLLYIANGLLFLLFTYQAVVSHFENNLSGDAVLNIKDESPDRLFPLVLK